MSLVDQFESVFRSSVKDVYQPEEIKLESALVICDLSRGEAEAFSEKVRGFLNSFLSSGHLTIELISKEDFETTTDLLTRVSEKSVDIICSYRNLNSQAWKFRHSLGEHLDVLVQKTDVPVLILPHPESAEGQNLLLKGSNSVMAMTNHLCNDHHLVNVALKLSKPSKKLHLVHIEDQANFERMMAAISKIPTVDTDEVKEKLGQQLLKEPSDYINSCERFLVENKTEIKLEKTVKFGQHLNEYKKLTDEFQVNLLVMRSRDDDQLAMHGMAYPLAVELNHLALLMI